MLNDTFNEFVDAVKVGNINAEYDVALANICIELLSERKRKELTFGYANDADT
jgi:hypothetical protein